MDFELFDEVKINQEITRYANNGIHKDCDGVIIEINGSAVTVVFLNPLNYGDYAVAQVEKENLTFLAKSRFAENWQDFLTKIDKGKTSFIPCDVKEYDKVELIVEKPKYAIEGVHKGMTGCVISSYAIDNEWLIIFSEDGTGKDIADICVAREDFKVIK